MKTTILGTRQLPLPRVPTATLKGFLMVYQHKSIKHGHLKIITMIRKNDKDIKQGCNDKTNNENPMQGFTGTGFSSNLPVLTGTGDKNRVKKTTNYKNKPSLH